MKKTLRTLMMGMMALLGCTALTSCTNDDEPQVAQQEGKKGYVEFTLSRGADTRTAYAANTDGGLDVKWSKDDKMVVFYNLNETDEIIEVFDLVSGAGTTTGKFAKSNSQLAEKTGEEVVIVYFPNYDSKKSTTENVLDLSTQKGTLAEMSNFDMFGYVCTISEGGKISVDKYVKLMSILHFPIGLDFGVEAATADFVFSGGYNKATINSNQLGDITVKDVSLSGGKLNQELYVVVAADNTPTKLTIGDNAFSLPTGLDAGLLYTFAQKDIKFAQAPLTIKAIEDGTITISNPNELLITYSINDKGKVSYKNETITISDLKAGDKVQLYGNNKAYVNSENLDKYTNIQSSAACKVYGNIMSLISSSDYSTLTAFGDGTSYIFANLFKDNTNLTDASGLILPATTLADYCYENMFAGCTALTTAPELPATTLASNCYLGMFKGCTLLTTAPALNATNLAPKCYADMFNGCTALTTAPALNATTLEMECYQRMFYNCTKLTEAPALPANSLAESCYDNMFAGCTALTTAPALNATTLADYCYYAMFSGCTSLTATPELNATTLEDFCYAFMFEKCSNLSSATALPATILEDNCYDRMFNGCTSLTTAPELPATTLATACYREMFKGCEKLNFVTCLATDISAKNCTTDWLYGVAASGTFTKAAGSSWSTGPSGIPSGWSVKNYGE